MPEFNRLMRQTTRMNHLKSKLPRPLWPVIDFIWKKQIAAYLRRYPSEPQGK